MRCCKKVNFDVGVMTFRYENDLGNFHIEDELLKRISLNDFQVSDDPFLKEGQLEIDLGESPFHVRFSNPKYDVVVSELTVVSTKLN